VSSQFDTHSCTIRMNNSFFTKYSWNVLVWENVGGVGYEHTCFANTSTSQNNQLDALHQRQTVTCPSSSVPCDDLNQAAIELDHLQEILVVLKSMKTNKTPLQELGVLLNDRKMSGQFIARGLNLEYSWPLAESHKPKLTGLPSTKPKMTVQ
jgi:hypothetical protein